MERWCHTICSCVSASGSLTSLQSASGVSDVSATLSLCTVHRIFLIDIVSRFSLHGTLSCSLLCSLYSANGVFVSNLPVLTCILRSTLFCFGQASGSWQYSNHRHNHCFNQSQSRIGRERSSILGLCCRDRIWQNDSISFLSTSVLQIPVDSLFPLSHTSS